MTRVDHPHREKTYERIPSRVHTYSGIMIDPLDLDPKTVRIIDIAHHLANQCRFSGATKWHYSVAQHAYIASTQVEPEFAWDALHHDDAEYALQDMAKPLKVDERLGQAYRGAEGRIERVLRPLLDVRFPMPPEVKDADERMLVTEADQLMHGRSEWANFRDTIPYDLEIKKWSPEKAKQKWLARFYELAQERGFKVTRTLGAGMGER